MKIKSFANLECTFGDLLMANTKVGLYESLKALGVKFSTKLKKAEIADMIEAIFVENPFIFVDILPQEEQEILSKLIGCKQSEYVDIPISEQRLGL